MNDASKKTKLIEAATQLFHTQGINATSLKDIAEKAGVPLGNVYYYFKSKDELGLAAAEEQMGRLKGLLKSLEEQSQSPKKRIVAAIRFFESVKDRFAQFGCPVAQVCQSTLPATDVVGKSYANVYREHLDWLEAQFSEMGCKKDSAQYARQVLIGIQGAGLLAKALGSPQIISEELERLVQWVQNLA